MRASRPTDRAARPTGASIELLIAAVFLIAPTLREPLGHRPPRTVGWALALSSIPAVVLTDALYERAVRRRADRR